MPSCGIGLDSSVHMMARPKTKSTMPMLFVILSSIVRTNLPRQAAANDKTGRTLFIDAFFSDDKQDYEKHKSGTRAHYLSAIEQSLKGSDVASKGPYITGTEFTYADVVLFQIVHDENLLDGGLKDYPRIAQVAEAVRSRPNVKKFLASDSYLG